MKVNTSYSQPVAAQQRPQSPPTVQAGAERNDAESRLRELIAQKQAEFDSFRPVEELGKHLDLRV